MVEEVGFEQTGLQAGKRYSPRVEQFTATLKSFLFYKSAVAGLIIVLIYVGITMVDIFDPALFGIPAATYTYINTYAPQYATTQQTYPSPFAPGFSHGFIYWFGGTIYNYPLLPAMFASLKFDLGYSFLIVAIGATVGSIVGVTAGYLGRWADELMMRITDIFFSIPFLIIVIAFTVAFTAPLHSSLNAMLLALIIVWWPIYARLTRSLALTTKSLNYVEAATAAGSSRIRNIFYHVFPNVLSPVFVQISLDLGSIILIFATLSFLGVGGFFPNGTYTFPELGGLISNGEVFMLSWSTNKILGTAIIWWPIVIPGIFLLIFTVSINLFGDGLRDALDPKLRK